MNCMQQKCWVVSLMGNRRSEVTAMRERFSVTELTALRNDLLQGGLIDSREAADRLLANTVIENYRVEVLP